MLQAGATAPEFRIGDFSLREHLNQGPLLLVLFKISCPTCQFTLPYLNRLFDRGLPVFGVSQDDIDATREFTDYFGLTFPMLHDGAGCPVSNAFSIDHVPSLFLVEPDGRISWALNGFHKAELEKLGARVGGSPFREGERVPAMRPG